MCLISESKNLNTWKERHSCPPFSQSCLPPVWCTGAYEQCCRTDPCQLPHTESLSGPAPHARVDPGLVRPLSACTGVPEVRPLPRLDHGSLVKRQTGNLATRNKNGLTSHSCQGPRTEISKAPSPDRCLSPCECVYTSSLQRELLLGRHTWPVSGLTQA